MCPKHSSLLGILDLACLAACNISLLSFLIDLDQRKTQSTRFPDVSLGSVSSFRVRRSWQTRGKRSFLVLKKRALLVGDLGGETTAAAAAVARLWTRCRVSPLSRDIFGLAGRRSERKRVHTLSANEATNEASAAELSSWQKTRRRWPDSPKVADDLVSQGPSERVFNLVLHVDVKIRLPDDLPANNTSLSSFSLSLSLSLSLYFFSFSFKRLLT